KDFTIVRRPYEPMALADEQRDNSARARGTAAFRRSYACGVASRCRLSDGTSRVHGHVNYQRGSERRRGEWPPPNPPLRAGFGRASLTVRLRPPTWLAFNSRIAVCASSSLLISTKANPRPRPATCP